MNIHGQSLGRRRRGIYSLVSISILIGFVLATSAVLLTILSDYADIATSNAECYISGALHSTGSQMAYFTMTLHNLGSEAITSANVRFIDDDGISHGFSNSTLAVLPGEAWNRMGSFPASISEKKQYPISATAIFEDNSAIVCTG